MNRKSGQATTEILLLLPLFVILGGAVIAVGYMCWQGLKVQQAANWAARMQGQERIGGGTSQQAIRDDNGMNSRGDSIPKIADGRIVGGAKAPPSGGVYGRYYEAVQSLFGSREQAKLFIKAPETGINTDKVTVARVIEGPRLWNGWKMQPIVLEASAYGGEDPRMYGLPRWGQTGKSASPFYKGEIKGRD